MTCTHIYKMQWDADLSPCSPELQSKYVCKNFYIIDRFIFECVKMKMSIKKHLKKISSSFPDGMIWRIRPCKVNSLHRHDNILSVCRVSIKKPNYYLLFTTQINIISGSQHWSFQQLKAQCVTFKESISIKLTWEKVRSSQSFKSAACTGQAIDIYGTGHQRNNVASKTLDTINKLFFICWQRSFLLRPN